MKIMEADMVPVSKHSNLCRALFGIPICLGVCRGCSTIAVWFCLKVKHPANRNKEARGKRTRAMQYDELVPPQFAVFTLDS